MDKCSSVARPLVHRGESALATLAALGGEHSQTVPDLPSLLDPVDEVRAHISDLSLSSDQLRTNAATALDIVRPNAEPDAVACCFTKGYGRYFRGTGSVVHDTRMGAQVAGGGVGDSAALRKRKREGGEAVTAAASPTDDAARDERKHAGRVKCEASGDVTAATPLAASDTPSTGPVPGKGGSGGEGGAAHWSEGLLEEGLVRYFSPGEICRLLGFPTELRWPASTSLRSKFALLGNSVHVLTIQALLQVARRVIDSDAPAP